VVLSDNANGQVAADAVAFERVGLPPPTTTWTPPLPRRDEYEVYARWTANSFRSTAVPYTVFHEGGSTTVTKNQQTNGGSWQLLGTFVMAPGQNHRVEMTDVTPDGTYIIADAVRFVPKANVPKIASWSFTVATTGSYKLYAKWPASSAHATDAQYTVTHASGTSTVAANQRVNGGQWNLLGTYSFNAGTSYKVELSDQVTAGKVAADAIYLAGTAAPTDSFTWTPTLPSAGSWRILVRWPVSSGNTAAARYTVTHAGGTTVITLNQKQNGGVWNSLGTYSLTPGAGHKVTLAASTDGTTIADALLFAGPTVQPANLLYVHADHLGSPQKLTNTSQAIAWDGVFDPFGEEVALTGLAAMPMRFPGQYADDETGYSYNYFRDYEPTLGRYTQSDPVGLDAGFNTYAYVDSNSLKRIDALGLAGETVKPAVPEGWPEGVPVKPPLSDDKLRQCTPEQLKEMLKALRNSGQNEEANKIQKWQKEQQLRNPRKQRGQPKMRGFWPWWWDYLLFPPGAECSGLADDPRCQEASRPSNACESCASGG